MLLKIILTFALAYSLNAEAGWFCEEASSERSENMITTCGIGEAPTEDVARKKALEAAFEELDSLCERSVDCKTMETIIEPQRSDCRVIGKNTKCYRAIQAVVTNTKRSSPFVKGKAGAPEVAKLDIAIKLDINELKKLQGEEKRKCSVDVTLLTRAFLDVSSKAKLQNMVTEAIKVPFEMNCLQAHYTVMQILEGLGQKEPNHIDFLIKALDAMEDPAADDRAYLILNYFQKLAPMEENEWKSALSAVARTKSYSLYRMMPRLFNLEATTPAAQAVEKARVELLGTMIHQGKIGRPVPVDMDVGMELMLRSLKSYKNKSNPWLALYAYEKFKDKLKKTHPEKLHSSLNTLYVDAELEPQNRLNKHIAENVKTSPPTYDLSRKIVDYLEHFKSSILKLDDEEDDDIKTIKALTNQRTAFIKDAGDQLGQNLAITKQDYEVKARRLLCIENQINCGDLLPDKSRLAKLLSSKKSQKRLEALEVLERLPSMARQLEKEIITGLEEAVNGDLDNPNALIRSGAQALAVIPTKDKKALELLVELSLNSRLHMQYIRKDLGQNLEPFWLKELQKKNERSHLVILMELQEFKKLTPATCEHLRSLANSKREYFIKDAAQKGLRACK